MKKYKIQLLNSLSDKGLRSFPAEHYETATDYSDPDVMLVRSLDMHQMTLPASVLAVGRAGAGVNTIPVEPLALQGVPVFNTPGANANAVKELVIAGLLLACRNVCQAWDYVQHLEASDEALDKAVEQGKKRFVGTELAGCTLGVIGLGAIGVQVANAAVSLGMQVIGYDPVITVKQAWQLDRTVKQADTLEQLLATSDFITLHVPMNAETRHMLNQARFSVMKANAVLLNFARGAIVEKEALQAALENGQLRVYVTDFPDNVLRKHPKVISLPHLGASTAESEENCAVMVAEQIRQFLETGNISNAVNFPHVYLPWHEGYRISIINENVPNMVGQISTHLAQFGFNVLDLINKSKGSVAYTLIDVDKPVSQAQVQALTEIAGIIRVRLITQPGN